MKRTQIKKKVIQLCILSASGIVLNACGNSGSVTKSAGDFSATKQTPRVVAISVSPILPTQDGVSGEHKLHVDNHTGKKLTLIDTYVSGAPKAQAVAESKSVKVNALACSVLDIDGACTIGFTPKELDGSSVVKLTFKDADGNLHTAAQLLEYSSSIDKISPSDGFYVSNANIEHVQTTNHYTLSIPFISDDDYESVAVSSRIITLQNSISCANGVSKGAHCTALLTFPSAPQEGYSNSISIKGSTTSGSARFANLTSGSSYNDIAHLAITSSTQVIKAASGNPQSLVKTINIVNTGVVPAINVSGVSSDSKSTLFGGDATTSYLDKVISCDGKVQASLPNLINPAQSCEIKFTLNNENATGSEDYSVSYKNGVDGGKTTTAITKIYYRGLVTPDYAYIVTGYANLYGAEIGKTVTTTLRVINTGTKAIQEIAIPTTLPTGLTIDKKASTCEAFGANGLKLAVGDYCTYALLYAPTAITTGANLKIDISAKSTATTPALVTPAQSLLIGYSAVTSGNGLIIVNNSKGYLIFADGEDKRTSTVLIQNTGTSSFSLNAIDVKNGSWPQSLTMNAPDKIDGVDNPLKNVGAAITGSISEKNISIGAGKVAALEYQYGPVKNEETGLAIQELVGVFSGTGSVSTAVYKLVNNTGYKAVNNGIKVTLDSVKKTGAVLPSPYDYVLFNTQPVSVAFKYQAGSAKITGFRVNDNNLPFGFTLKKADTTCPTTSNSSVVGDLAANGSCLATYLFMDPTQLNHSLFYTAAAGNDVMFKAPAYSVADETSIHIATPAFNVTLKPKPFATVTATATPVIVGEEKRTTVVFKISSIDQMAKSSAVVIKPSLPQNFYFDSVGSCSISAPEADQTCTIIIVSSSKTAASTAIPFTYALANSADYNAINGVLTIN